MMSIPTGFLCPSCGQPLSQKQRSLVCRNGHSFDLSKEGYVNLLLSSSRHSKEHGDNREMIRSRRDFLNQGYYRCLQKALCEAVLQLCPPSPTIVDAGCGEGYYTTAVFQALREKNSSQPGNIFGFDMSKEALRIAAKRCPEIHFAVANLFSMPLPDHYADFVMELFAPIADREFLRILKPGGILLLTVPGPQHLFELKQAVYDTPYPNQLKELSFPGFTFLKSETIHDTIRLSSSRDIKSLFAMTPYFFRTPAHFAKRLDTLEQLTTQIEFTLHIYKKNK